MRRLKIRHLTEYRFVEPVTLHTHRLRLRPREGHDIHIESSLLKITPANKVIWFRDGLDNVVAEVDFREMAATLAITSEVIIQHFDEAPLDFLVADYAVNYPFQYSAHDRADLHPFLDPVYPLDAAAIMTWLDSIGLRQPELQTFTLLDRMSQVISGNFNYTVREEEGVNTPAQTLANGWGSCRDFAALFVEACRHHGLASRFVSGYSHTPGLSGEPAATHAWAEAYLPGAGWKGFDPTRGGVTGSEHIPVAVARHPETVPPVSGSFFGPAGRPEMVVEVQVTELPETA